MTVDSLKRERERRLDAITKLQKDKSRITAKLSVAQKKETDALAAIRRTKSESAKRTKQRAIDVARSNQARLQKEISQIEEKILRATKASNCTQKKLDAEVRRENERRERNQIKESRKLAAMQESIKASEERQNGLDNRIAELEKIPEQITVLYLAASPTDACRVRIDEEAREIRESIARSAHRDSIQLETRAAVRPMDLFVAINETHPTIIHFSGHGAEDGALAFEDEDGRVKLISKEQIAIALSTATDHVKLLVFNACFSEKQAEAVAGVVGAAIGMKDPINDDAAVLFASQLYSSIGFGLSLEEAFSQAKARLVLDDCPDSDNPQLHVASWVDASRLRFVVEKQKPA